MRIVYPPAGESIPRNQADDLVFRFTISAQSEFLPYADPKSGKRILVEPDATQGQAHLIWKHPGPERTFKITITQDRHAPRVKAVIAGP